MVNIGISRQDLSPALEPGRAVLDTRVEVAALYASGGSCETVWAVLDFMDFNLHYVRTIRAAIHAATGVAAAHIHVLTTHNHGAGTPDVPTLARIAADTARAAQSRAIPARMRCAAGATEKPLNYTRRIFIPELEGVSTFWYGTDASDGYDASPHVEHAVNALREGRLDYLHRDQTARPYTPFPPADARVAVIAFEGLDGTPIGSVLRFASHVTSSDPGAGLSGDFPFHFRRLMEQALGGTALFINGPCADIGLGIRAKSPSHAALLGQALADAALRALTGTQAVPLETLDDRMVHIRMPVRREVLENRVDVPEALPEALPARRRYLERLRLRSTLPFLQEKYREGEESLSDEIPVEGGLLRFDGVVLAAFPGETFQATGRALEEAFPDLQLITAEEHGRTVMYMPPRAEFALGGYESVCMATAPGAESVLREGMLAALWAFLGQPPSPAAAVASKPPSPPQR